jgi:heat shock protein HslJ
MRWILGSMLSGVALAVTACGAAPQPAPPVAEQAPEEAAVVVDEAPDALIGRMFVAETLEGEPVADDVESTLRFESEGRVVGSAGCNNFQGTYEVEGSTLSFGPMAVTRKMCPPAVMDQEAAFLQAMEKVRIFTWGEDGSLLLGGEDGEPSRFVPFVDAPENAG